MKKSKNVSLIFLSGLLILITLTAGSCSKDGGDEGDEDGPTISSISPSSTLTGATITITGNNLSSSAVTIGGIATSISENTETYINTTIPAGATIGVQEVKVTNSMGSATANVTVTGAGAGPEITSISPEEVSKGGTLTITGTGLAGAVVEIATKVSEIKTNTATSITVVVPSTIALDAASVRVTTPLGTTVSSVIIIE